MAAGGDYGRVQGLDVVKSSRCAATLATLNLETKGPFAGTVDDVWARLPR